LKQIRIYKSIIKYNKIFDLFESDPILVLSKDVLNLLNKRKPSKIPFEATKPICPLLESRIKEKFKIEDFSKVIDHKIKEWKTISKMKNTFDWKHCLDPSSTDI
jgi:uncharacterized phage protein (TIGR02220 family)